MTHSPQLRQPHTAAHDLRQASTNVTTRSGRVSRSGRVPHPLPRIKHKPMGDFASARGSSAAPRRSYLFSGLLALVAPCQCLLLLSSPPNPPPHCVCGPCAPCRRRVSRKQSVSEQASRQVGKSASGCGPCVSCRRRLSRALPSEHRLWRDDRFVTSENTKSSHNQIKSSRLARGETASSPSSHGRAISEFDVVPSESVNELPGKCCLVSVAW